MLLSIVAWQDTARSLHGLMGILQKQAKVAEEELSEGKDMVGDAAYGCTRTLRLEEVWDID